MEFGTIDVDLGYLFNLQCDCVDSGARGLREKVIDSPALFIILQINFEKSLGHISGGGMSFAAKKNGS